MSSVELLLISAAMMMLYTSLHGFFMLALGQFKLANGINMRYLGSVHMEFITLAPSKALMAGIIMYFEPDSAIAWIMSILYVVGAWVAPASYFAKAFGIDGFRYDGSPAKKCFSIILFASVVLITVPWAYFLYAALQA